MTSFLNVVLVITFYQTGPDGLFYFSKVFNLILQSAEELKYFNDPKNETYYFICRSGDLSHHVCQLLKSKGYNNLINISDGILNWKGKIQSIN